MKIKTYTSLFFIFMLLGIFILSCTKEKCSQQPDETYYLSSTDKAQIPYYGTDTLKFLHNAVDTILFIGQGKQSYFNVESGSGGDCPGANQKYEGYDIIYTSSQFSRKIFFSLGIYAPYSSTITTNFNNSNFNYPSEEIPFTSKSIIVLNKNYNNVSLFYSSVNSDTLYFNKSAGILKISTLTDKWEIIKS